MRKSICWPLIMCGLWLFVGSGLCAAAEEILKLPPPRLDGKVSVEAAMLKKKSVREFKAAPLKLADVSQLLWAANGDLPVDAVTSSTTKVIPSAGGLYPLEIYLACGDQTVEGLASGVYHYLPKKNGLKPIQSGDRRTLLGSAALGQMCIAKAPATLVIAAVFSRTAAKYGPRATQYVYIEAGNADQNVHLQAESLQLRCATIGAFQEPQVAAVLKLPKEVTPVLLVPVGK
ncbi:MAG: SagB/ThcOx family dehydrogenase [Thermodesulfobacteriota bacterium]